MKFHPDNCAKLLCDIPQCAADALAYVELAAKLNDKDESADALNKAAARFRVAGEDCLAVRLELKPPAPVAPAPPVILKGNPPAVRAVPPPWTRKSPSEIPHHKCPQIVKAGNELAEAVQHFLAMSCSLTAHDSKPLRDALNTWFDSH